MERLKPLDLERMQLRRRLRGYDPKTTDQVLVRAAREIELLLKEQADTRDLADKALAELDRYRTLEKTLQETLLMAQKAADETRANAHREADLILESARREALESRHQAQASVHDLRWDLERLRLERQKFVQQFKALMEEQLLALDEGRSAQLALIEFGAEPELRCEEGVG